MLPNDVNLILAVIGVSTLAVLSAWTLVRDYGRDAASWVWDKIARFWQWLFKIPSMAATVIGLIITLTLNAFGFYYISQPRADGKHADIVIVSRQRVDDLQDQIAQIQHKVAQLEAEVHEVHAPDANST